MLNVRNVLKHKVKLGLGTGEVFFLLFFWDFELLKNNTKKYNNTKNLFL